MWFTFQRRLLAAILITVVITGAGVGIVLAPAPAFPWPAGTWFWLGLVAAAAALAAAYTAGWGAAPLKRTRKVIEAYTTDGLRNRLYVTEVEDEAGRIMLELNGLMDRLEDGMARHRQFVGAISHDIRTPLTIIKGDIEVALMRERSVEEYQEVLRSNQEEVQRIQYLVEDLVTLARADYGELGLNVRAVSLAGLATEVREGFGEAVRRKGLILESYISGDAMLEGDQAKLRQMLHNLLGNAVAYTPSGGTIELMVVTDAERDEVRFQVRDTGIGISPQDLPHIFEAFYRGTPSRRGAGHEGYGLGLTICSHIVRAHGGRIQVESREGPGSGTTFTVTLPRRSRGS